MMAPEFLRYALFGGCFAMLVLSMFFLRGRELSARQYILWGLLAVAVPLLGPYLVIIFKPGSQRKHSHR
jgi:predicted cobalt transporter CbtA